MANDEKKAFWKESEDLRRNLVITWCVRVDFNESFFVGKGKGEAKVDMFMRVFSKSMDKFALVDLPMFERRSECFHELD